MFKLRYWREYPWWLQLFQLVIMIFIFISLASAIAFLVIDKIIGVPLADIATVSVDSPRALKDAALVYQFLSSFFLFLVPSILFAYATHPRPAEYLGMRKPGKPIQWPLVIMTMLGAIPIMLTIASWFKMIDFGEQASRLQEENDRMMQALLSMDSGVDFIKVFLVLAVLPAIGEELLFRSLMMRFAAKRFRNMAMPVSISAVFFAFMHSSAYGFVSILMAGALLGIIYYYTSSIWCSMLAHALNNGLQVTLLYFAAKGSMLYNAMQEDHLPWYISLIGLVVFCISFYLLWKNRTPLPANWSDDFTYEEANSPDTSGS